MRLLVRQDAVGLEPGDGQQQLVLAVGEVVETVVDVDGGRTGVAVIAA